MRRHWLIRSLASLLAIWLPLVLGEPGLVHACPMHGGPVATVSASHHGMDAGAHASHDAPAGEHGHHTCTCVNTCGATGLAVLVPERPAVPVAAAVSVAVAPQSPETTFPRLAAPYFLPFANGPPPRTSVA